MSAAKYTLTVKVDASDVMWLIAGELEKFNQIIAERDALLEAAEKLAARGFFTPVSCADEATLAEMKLMRDAIAKATGGAA